jgi:hypothetical protein
MPKTTDAIEAIDDISSSSRAAQQKRLLDQWQALIDQLDRGEEPNIIFLQKISVLSRHNFSQLARAYAELLVNHLRNHDIKKCTDAYKPTILGVTAHVAVPLILNFASLGTAVVPTIGGYTGNKAAPFTAASGFMQAGAGTSNNVGNILDSLKQGERLKLESIKDDSKRNLNEHDQKTTKEQQEAQKNMEALKEAQRQEYETKRSINAGN